MSNASEHENDNETKVDNRPAFGEHAGGVAIGVGGCLIIAIAFPLGTLGGCYAGSNAYEWYNRDIQQPATLDGLWWLAFGGLFGGFAVVFVAAIILILICRQK